MKSDEILADLLSRITDRIGECFIHFLPDEEPDEVMPCEANPPIKCSTCILEWARKKANATNTEDR